MDLRWDATRGSLTITEMFLTRLSAYAESAGRMPPAPLPARPSDRLVSFEQRLDVGALGRDCLEERHVLPGRPAVDDGRKGDPAAVALAQIAGDPADRARVVERAGLQRHTIEPRRVPLAQKDEWSFARHDQAAVERREAMRIVILIGEQVHEVVGGQPIVGGEAAAAVDRRRDE